MAKFRTLKPRNCSIGKISESLQWNYKPLGKISESLQWNYKSPGKINESLQWNFKSPGKITESLHHGIDNLSERYLNPFSGKILNHRITEGKKIELFF